MEETQNKVTEVKIIPIADVKPNPQNRNKHTEDQIVRLMKLIHEHGVRQPLIISNKSGLLVVGHGRLEAFKRLGLSQVPVLFQDFKSDEEEFQFGIADNAIAEWSNLDFVSINEDIKNLGPFDIDLLGIKNFEIDVSDKYADSNADHVPSSPSREPISKLGDLYILGNHRLLCGDSTNLEYVEKLMNGNTAEITFTSPPYNMGVARGGSNSHIKYISDSDSKSDDQYFNFLSKFLENSFRFSKTQFINIQLLEGGKRSILNWLSKMSDHYLDELIWLKDKATPCPPGVITHLHEMIYIFSNEINQNRRIHNAQFKHLYSVIENPGQIKGDFSEFHNATFPIDLAKKIVVLFSNEKSIIYEPFGGSGTTLIASEISNRTCMTIELEPLYVDIILERWASLTGKDPIREDGIKWSDLKAQKIEY